MIVILVAALVAGAVFATTYVREMNKVVSIYLAKAPDKISYYQGDAPDYDGLVVMAMRANGKTYQIPTEECIISGFDSSKPTESCKVKVMYDRFSTSFIVIIKDTPKETPIPVGLTFEKLPQTEYKVGDWLYTEDGIMVVEFSDGSTLRLTMLNKYVISGFTTDAPGTYEVTVEYHKNGVPVYATYTINVTE